MDPTSSIIGGWKILGGLHDAFQNWNLRKKKTKQAKEQLARAAELMLEINRRILLGDTATEPELEALIKEFKQLVRNGAAPKGSEQTADWIVKATPAVKKGAPAKKAAPGKKAAPAKKATPAKKVAPTRRG